MHALIAGGGWLVPPRSAAAELIDMPGVDDGDLRGNLHDLARINRWAGGVWLTLRALESLAPPGAPLHVLDVATGAGDMPRAIAAWAARRGTPAQVFACDISPPVVRIAAAHPRPNAITFAAADGCRLPLADASVDVALCSFVLHHLEPDAAVGMLREMARVARCGIVVNDLLRAWPSWWAARALGPVISRNPLTRHDGPLSVLRAYTRPELAAMLARAGLHVRATHRFAGYRVALVAQKCA